MAGRSEKLARFKRRLQRLRLHHNTCEERFSQASLQVKEAMAVKPTQFDSIPEKSTPNSSKSEFFSHTGSDPEYCPPKSMSESSDKEYVNSQDKSSPCEKSSSEDQDHDTSLSDDDKHKGKCINKKKNSITYVNKQQKKNKKHKMNATVTIKTCTKREDKKQVLHKRHYCLYCRKSNSHIVRHLQRKHMEIKDVAHAFSFPLRSQERMVLLEQLKNKGDFKHNTKVLKKGRGQLVARRQPSDKASVKYYLPCHYCFGMFAKKNLWRHQSSCKSKTSCVADDKKKRRGSVQSRAACLLPIAASSNGCQDIVNNMQYDDVSFHIRRDDLICKYGESLYGKHGRVKSRCQYISRRMRELGRFVLAAKDMDKSVRVLEDLCTPSKFQLVVSVAKRLTEFSPRKNEYGNPSKAVKIEFCLKGAVKVLIGQSLMNDDELAEKKAKKFLELLHKNWNNIVSVSAHQSIQEKQCNKQNDIPLTNDVVALRDHLRMVEDEAKNELMQCLGLTSYKMLNETVLAQVIVFNKRREGEASHLTLEAYKQASIIPINEDIYETLTPSEKELSKLLTRIEVRGKRGRKVPVFFTDRMKESIDLLIKMREGAGVPSENPYLFARSGAKTNIRGCDCFQKYAEESKAENPELLRSTKLRKQVATLCQLRDLSEQELEQVARFMGHDIRVHRDFYRQTDKTFQIAKISKLLFAMEQGTGTLSGKNLDTISVFVGDESPTSTSDSDRRRQGKRHREVDEGESPTSTFECVPQRTKKRGSETDKDQSPGASLVKKPLQKKKTGKPIKTVKVVEQGPEVCSPKRRLALYGDDKSSDTDDQNPGRNLLKMPFQKKKTGKPTKTVKTVEPPIRKVRRPWSELERNAVNKHLASFIAERRVPGKDQCLNCLRLEKDLAQRTWKDVKSFVQNAIVTLNIRAASRLLKL